MFAVFVDFDILWVRFRQNLSVFVVVGYSVVPDLSVKWWYMRAYNFKYSYDRTVVPSVVSHEGVCDSTCQNIIIIAYQDQVNDG